jgi:diguanylate cyclase (GGDEF)-like protein
VALAAVATALLIAAFLLSPWARRPGRQGMMTRTAPVVVVLMLLVSLCALLAVAPPYEPTGFPFAQTILLALVAVLFAAAFVARRRDVHRSADVIDSATVDALTRIASHRVFQDRLVHECERAYRFGDSFVLVLLDLDNFHTVNNRHGHGVGDHILLDLARRIKIQLRDIDLLARFGGDRFAMILPHTQEKGGVRVAERIRQNIAGWVFFAPAEAEIRLTVTVGLGSYPSDGTSAPDLVEVTERALAFAKALGGNQVQAYSELPAREVPGNVVIMPNSGREAIVRSLAAAVDIRDGYTRTHSRLVSELSAAVAKRIGLSPTEVARISVGALLHDVGKIGIPDAILAKEGSLSSEEWDCVREHPILGRQILEQAPELTDVTPLVLHHQERYDGTGYPDRLHGDEIPLGARIIAAADAYHAITSDRPYRGRRNHSEAMRELRRYSGAQFDPEVVDTMMEIFESDERFQTLSPSDQTETQLFHPFARPAALKDDRSLADHKI